jgi:hypothetical protein
VDTLPLRCSNVEEAKLPFSSRSCDRCIYGTTEGGLDIN